ncbi:MAG: Iron dependent repressor [Thermoanaerobacterales bacterium 50_218]|nr:MAG: Iron dependent repressor [Thermoanaerobacterales bacterium 50_218]
MELTERQKEFLKQIFDNYVKHKTPIHYSAVAQWLGVSKWTAYDMLRKLSKEGYLSPHYCLSRKGCPGRSILCYVPTKKLAQLLGREEELQREEWHDWKEMLLSRIESLRCREGHQLVGELSELLSETKTPMMFCAGVLALFAAYIRSVNEKGMQMVQQVAEAINRPEQRLSLLSGMVVGLLSKGSSGDDSPGEGGGILSTLVNKYHQYLERVDRKHYSLLSDFLDDLFQVVC